MADIPERISQLEEKSKLHKKDLFVIVDSEEPNIKKRTKKIEVGNVLGSKVNSIPPGGFVKVENIYLREVDKELILIT